MIQAQASRRRRSATVFYVLAAVVLVAGLAVAVTLPTVTRYSCPPSYRLQANPLRHSQVYCGETGPVIAPFHPVTPGFAGRDSRMALRASLAGAGLVVAFSLAALGRREAERSPR